MSNLYAFELAGDYSLDELNGATIAFGTDAQMLDIKAALVAGDGLIVTGSPDVIGVLRGVEILRSVDVPEGAQPTPLGVTLPEDVPQEPVTYTPQTTDVVAANSTAVHADEPATVDEAAVVPDSQAQAQQVTGETAGDGDDDEINDESGSTGLFNR